MKENAETMAKNNYAVIEKNLHQDTSRKNFFGKV